MLARKDARVLSMSTGRFGERNEEMAVQVLRHKTENARANVARAQEVPPHPQKRDDEGRCAGSVQDIWSERCLWTVRCKQRHRSKLKK